MNKFEAKSLTDRNADAWSHLDAKWREQRMLEWANMLEKRVAELDPNYLSYPWGRSEVFISTDEANRIESTERPVLLLGVGNE